MGVERSITRWYVQRQLLLGEIAQLEAKIASSSTNDEAIEAQPVPVPLTQLEFVEETQRLSIAREKLHTLGECPRPMMG